MNTYTLQKKTMTENLMWQKEHKNETREYYREHSRWNREKLICIEDGN